MLTNGCGVDEDAELLVRRLKRVQSALAAFRYMWEEQFRTSAPIVLGEAVLALEEAARWIERRYQAPSA